MARRHSLAAVLVLMALVACGSDETDREKESAETRAIMREIYAALRVALLASAREEPFGDATARAENAAALTALADNAALLERHSRRRDDQMHFLARSVARDSNEVLRAYEAGRMERASFLLYEITENCIVCHTRLPDREDSPLAEGFANEEVLRGLAPESRASLQIATRRFDEALVTLEAVLASDEHPALLLGPLTDYLVVNVRVKDDYERPLPTLRRFAERPDLWTRLRRDVEAWIDALPALRSRVRGEPSLALARELVAEGRALAALPGDHAPLAHFVVASAVLQRFIDAHEEVDVELAEAFHLLGVLEARIGRNYWVTPAPFLLERSIRLAPEAPFAQEAYALLEEELLLSYEGASEELPAEEEARLRELRALMED